MLPDPDIPIGCGTISELRLEDILVGALGCQLQGIRIQICSAQCGHKRHGHHEKGIDLESHAEATDLGIRYLLPMAAELSATVLAAVLAADLSATVLAAKLSAMMLAAKLSAMIANPSLMMLVNIPVVLPYNLAQTSSFLGMTLAGM